MLVINTEMNIEAAGNWVKLSHVLHNMPLSSVMLSP